MASFQQVTPIFPVRDIDRALQHYGALGFAGRAYDDGSGGPAIYGFLERDGVQIHLTRAPDLDPVTSSSACYLHVTDADVVHSEWRNAGLPGEWAEPTDTPWGMHEFSHVDPDGNLLRVGNDVGRD